MALARRAFRDARVRTITFGYLFAAYAYIQPAGYRSAYPTIAARRHFAESFAGNAALRLFYGLPHDLLTVSGYTAWRVGGTLAIAAAAFGVLAPVRALRAEEDAGRAELVLAGVVSRRLYHRAALAAIAAATLVLWLITWLGFVLGGLAAGGSAFLALAIVSVIPSFVGIGALACQLAPSRRIALAIGMAAVAVSLLLRAVADTSGGVGWLRWAAPLGWAEELRPFAGPRPWLLLLPIALFAALWATSVRIARRRDLGTGVLPARDQAPARFALLSSPAAQALRSERVVILVWMLAAAAFAYIFGAVAKSVPQAGLTKQLRDALAKLGVSTAQLSKGYLGFCYLLLALAVSLFACSQVAATRSEEEEQQAQTLLALPVSRRRWLLGRLGVAIAGAAAIAVAGGVLGWAGASSQGLGVSLPSMLLAGVNSLPVTLLALAVGALAYAIVSRASTAIAYSLVGVAFMWYLLGSLVRVPSWLVQATPFAHIALVPAAPFRLGAAAVMAAIAVAVTVAAVELFARLL